MDYPCEIDHVDGNLGMPDDLTLDESDADESIALSKADISALLKRREAQRNRDQMTDRLNVPQRFERSLFEASSSPSDSRSFRKATAESSYQDTNYSSNSTWASLGDSLRLPPPPQTASHVQSIDTSNQIVNTEETAWLLPEQGSDSPSDQRERQVPLQFLLADSDEETWDEEAGTYKGKQTGSSTHALRCSTSRG